MARKTRDNIAAAIARLKGEERVPSTTLATEVGVYYRVLERWNFAGKGGVWLDGYKRKDIGWVSSREAVQRFLEVIEGTRLSERPPMMKPTDVNELLAIATLAADDKMSGRQLGARVLNVLHASGVEMVA